MPSVQLGEGTVHSAALVPVRAACVTHSERGRAGGLASPSAHSDIGTAIMPLASSLVVFHRKS